MEMTIPLPAESAGTALDSYLNAVAERERRADAASLRHVLAPESVVVIGASRRRGTVGRAILDNIRTGGYAGRLYVVNPRARQIGGEHCLSSVLDLPEPADLAVIAVPGRGGAGRGRAMRPARRAVPGGDHVRARCRRLRGPARGVPPARHAAGRPELLRRGRARASAWTPRSPPGHPRPGVAGLVMQSGGLGFAHGRPAVPARRRDLLVRVGGRQARRVEQRHADVVGARRGHQARRAVYRVVRQPAQVRPDRPAGERQHARPGRAGRPCRGRPAAAASHAAAVATRWSAGRPCSSRPGSSPRPASGS